MGGSGSGNWYRWDTKATTNSYCSLDIHYLVTNGYIRDGIAKSGCSLTWSETYGGEKHVHSTIAFNVNTLEKNPPHLRVIYTNTKTKEDFDYKIYLTTTFLHYGGKRWWFTCPNAHCSRRVRKLYLGSKYFACRRCYNLTYESQNESQEYRLLTKAQNIHKQLGGSGCIDDWTPKPKGMHQKTYNRLMAEMERYYERAMVEVGRRFPINYRS